jgi:hypothetical protein
MTYHTAFVTDSSVNATFRDILTLYNFLTILGHMIGLAALETFRPIRTILDKMIAFASKTLRLLRTITNMVISLTMKTLEIRRKWSSILSTFTPLLHTSRTIWL